MLERDMRRVLFTCDMCGAEEDVEDVGNAIMFNSTWGEMRDRGWRAYQEGAEWRHKCPDCAATAKTWFEGNER